MTLEEQLYYGTKKGMKSITLQLLLLVEHIVTANYIWEGLPEEIEIDLPERTMFYFGQALFFKVADHYAMTQAVGQGTINIYGRFNEYRPILRGGQFSDTFLVRHRFTEDFSSVEEPEAVLVRNNEQALPTFVMVYPIVKRLADLWQTMGMKQTLSRVKGLIQANEGSARAIRQALSAIFESDELFPVVSDKRKGKGLPLLQELQTVQLFTEYEPTKDWYDFDKTWELLMTMLGVSSNAEQNKKERLLVDEVNANEQVVQLVNDMPIRLRKKGAEQINKLFGLSISVRTRSELEKEMGENENKNDPDKPSKIDGGEDEISVKE